MRQILNGAMSQIDVIRYFISMSFQGIRKIRDSKRESPILFNQQKTTQVPTLSPVKLSPDMKASHLSYQRKASKNAETKIDQRSNNSFATTRFIEKERRILFGNFLHINLDELKVTQNTKELKEKPSETVKSVRNSPIKRSTEFIQREDTDQPVSLNSFNLDFVVGKGGFGKVWKVYEKATNKVYAMKEMQKVKIISKRSVNSVMNEIKLLKGLKSPFLVNVVHSFQNRQNLFLVMDYCNRGDMRYHLGNRRKFKEDEVRFFLACIVLSLEYLHSKKIIHRDLKPQNLVIDDRGYVRVTDLGVSRQIKLNNAEDTSGTPGYMAPEVICKMNHSYAVDFFALGVISFEMMTGKRPYLGQNRKEIREKILAKQVQLDEIPPFGWSKQAVDFTNRLIQRKPEARLGTLGIEEVKFHSFFKKMDWQKLQKRQLVSPFLPQTVEEDYSNYKECISEDTEIADIQEYKLILRHKDTQEAFIGYDFNTTSLATKKKNQRKELEMFTHTTMGRSSPRK